MREGKGGECFSAEIVLLESRAEFFFGVDRRLDTGGKGGKPAAQEIVVHLGTDLFKKIPCVLRVRTGRMLCGFHLIAPGEPVSEGSLEGFCQGRVQPRLSGGILRAAADGDTGFNKFFHAWFELIRGRNNAIAVEEGLIHAVRGFLGLFLTDALVFRMAEAGEQCARRGAEVLSFGF